MVKNRIGLNFGKWKVIGEDFKIRSDGKKRNLLVCVCDCGTVNKVASSDLLSGKSKQCKKCSGTEFCDLSGKFFGDWHVLNRSIIKNMHQYWNCKCKCGNIVSVCGSSLKKGSSTKCRKCHSEELIKHGFLRKEKRHPLYNIWSTMIARCENPKHLQWKDYGGRGIKVCERWHSLESFAEDMGERPNKKSIDRIDNNGNYEPKNCKWATFSEQGSNKRSNHTETYQGKTKTLSQWSIFFKIKPDTLWHYLERNSFEKAYEHYKK